MKLPPRVSGADVIRALEQAGFTILRQEGSHVRLGRGAVRATVPLHAAVAPGTLKAISSLYFQAIPGKAHPRISISRRPARQHASAKAITAPRTHPPHAAAQEVSRLFLPGNRSPIKPVRARS